MARKPGRFVPYTRGYAKPNAFRRVGPVPGGLPPRRPRRTRRLADPRTYLGAVIVLAALGLVVLPVAADAVIAVTRPAAAAEGTCRIYQVIDGDTVRMVCPGRGNTSARLTGFDAPELFSPACASEFAAAVTAKWALRLKLWQAEKVTLVRGGTDRYGRALVTAFLDGAPLAGAMIASGHARPYAGGRRQEWCA